MRLNELKQEVLKNFNNVHNCIPYGFRRMRKRLPGVVKGEYTCITSGTGAGKSKFLKYYILQNVIDYVKQINNESELDVKFFVFSLELSALEFKADLLSCFLYRDHGIEIDYRELMSIPKKEERTLTQDIIDLIDSYTEWFEYFDKKVFLSSDLTKPSEIYNTILKWIKKHGKEVEEVNEDGDTIKKWEYYNPNLFVVPIVDHISLIESEIHPRTKQSLDLHGSMALLSRYMLKLKNYYNCHPHVVQQQALDKERIESDFSGKPKEQKLEPSLDGLANNKEIGRDYTCVIGIFSPARYDIPEHAGYNIAMLGDNYRSLKIIKGRYSTPNLRIGLLFNGAVGYFEELPKAEKLRSQLDYERLLIKIKR